MDNRKRHAERWMDDPSRGRFSRLQRMRMEKGGPRHGRCLNELVLCWNHKDAGQVCRDGQEVSIIVIERTLRVVGLTMPQRLNPHRTLFPILAQTLYLHTLPLCFHGTSSNGHYCLLGLNPLCRPPRTKIYGSLLNRQLWGSRRHALS